MSEKIELIYLPDYCWTILDKHKVKYIKTYTLPHNSLLVVGNYNRIITNPYTKEKINLKLEPKLDINYNITSLVKSFKTFKNDVLPKIVDLSRNDLSTETIVKIRQLLKDIVRIYFDYVTLISSIKKEIKGV